MDVIIDVSQITVETPRLLLRAFKESDLQDFFDYASVPGIGELAGWPHHESIEVSREKLQSFIEKKEVFAIYHKYAGKVIGSLGLHKSWGNDEKAYKDLKLKEIGYVLSKSYWRQGLMTEAVRAVIDYGFAFLGLDAFTCGHVRENIRSRRVIEKCGFAFVKECEYYARLLRRSFDDMKYILTKEMFEKASGA